MMTRKSGLRLAKRLDEVGFSDIVQIRNKVLELRASGQTVHAFHGGEPFFDTPEPIKYADDQGAGREQAHATRPPPESIPSAHGAWQRSCRPGMHIEATAEDVIVTAGGAHALYVAFQAAARTPATTCSSSRRYWTPIRDMVTLAPRPRALLVPTSTARRNWPHQNAGAITPRPHTRAIYYNTPQNPAGTVFTRSEAEEVAAFAKKHDLIVIADEAYEDLVYEGEHF